jgi:hypothetical protein
VQQAFTCCADLDGGSALFFGWSESYSRHTSIYAFVEKFLNNDLFFLENSPMNTGIWESNNNNINKLKNIVLAKSL